MTRILIYLSLCVACVYACGPKVEDFSAEKQLSKEAQDSFKFLISRYLGKLPGKADHFTKFDPTFDDYYLNIATQHDLWYYSKDKSTGEEYFLATRIAPSLYEKRVAIGGRLLRNDQDSILQYEEVFRTFKMKIPELEEKAALLYGLMIQKKDLSPFYFENSKGVEYIEFPNEEVKFDIIARRWMSSREDPLEPYYDMKR